MIFLSLHILENTVKSQREENRNKILYKSGELYMIDGTDKYKKNPDANKKIVINT